MADILFVIVTFIAILMWVAFSGWVAYSVLIFFIKTVLKDIKELETKLNKAYELEDDIRGDNYKDNDKTDLFIEAMEQKGWALI